MKSPLMKTLGMLVWFITAVACIVIGLMALKVDVYAWPLMNNPQTLLILQYVVGISGLISLLMMFMSHGCDSNCKK